jgi:hypothetical protein
MEQERAMSAAGVMDLALFPVEPAGEILFDSNFDSTSAEHNGQDRRRLLKRAVAALPPAAIAAMQRRELIFAIRTAELPWLAQAEHRLEHADRPTLERLAFLARRVCRRQLHGTTRQWREKAR